MLEEGNKRAKDAKARSKNRNITRQGTDNPYLQIHDKNESRQKHQLVLTIQPNYS